MSQCIKNGEGLISKLTQSYDGMLLSNKKALTTKQNKTKLMVRKHQGETSSALGWAWESSLKGCTSHELTHVTFWKRLHALYRNRKHIGAAECWQWGDRADYSGPTGMFRGGGGVDGSVFWLWWRLCDCTGLSNSALCMKDGFHCMEIRPMKIVMVFRK